MKKQDHLVSLVRSMTSSEKRYFKLFCSLQKGEKFYLQLFDYIDRTEDPTNQKIQAKFKGHPQIHYLPRIKHYLFHLILRSLRNFHDEKNLEAQLYNKLNEIRILYDKGLAEIALDMVEKSIELSRVHHLHSIRLELYKWRSKLADALYDLDMMRSVIDHDYDTAAALRHELDEYFEYLKIFDEFFYHYKRKGIHVDGATLEALGKVMSNPLMQDTEPSFFYSRMLYYSIRSTYALLTPGKLKESVHYLLQFLKVLDANVEVIRENPKTYFAVMNNLLSRLGIMGDKELFHEKIQEYRKFPAMLPADKRNVYEPRVYVNSLQVEMEFNYRYGNMEQAYELWKAEEKKIISMEDEISVEMRMVLLLSASKVCWITGKYQDSNKILNKILHDTENEDLREDIWFSVYYMKMLNYFELGDDKGIAVAYKLFSRQYIDENSRSVAIPDANIIGFFRKNHKQLLTLKPDEKMLKKELNSLLENITSMQQLNTLKYYEPFYIWLFAKASKIPSLEAFSQFRVTTKEIEEGLLSGKSA